MLYQLARPLLFHLNPESAHKVALPSLKLLCRLGAPGLPGGPLSSKPIELLGLTFPNAVGLAAGLDKNGEFIDALAACGFGFIEIGTVTPRPQLGNPRPRLFRIVEREAIINRMGFNNAGVDRVVENVRRSRYRGILGINIGKNADTPIERAAEDYLVCLQRVYSLASYVAVNVSSPNTKHLRQLQRGEELSPLLRALTTARDRLAREHQRRVPLAVKIAPDLDDAGIAAIARALIEHGIDAAIATNTTITRADLQGFPYASESGGLSGVPLRPLATAMIGKLAAALRGRVPIIGVGGIMSATDAAEKLAAGASLVQLYTGLVYRGPGLVRTIVNGLVTPASRAA